MKHNEQTEYIGVLCTALKKTLEMEVEFCDSRDTDQIRKRFTDTANWIGSMPDKILDEAGEED